MWHRLPYDQKRKPANASLRTGRDHRSRRSTRGGTHSRRHRDARRRPGRPHGSDGTTSSTSTGCTSPPSTSILHNVTNAEFLEFVEGGRLSTTRASGQPRTGLAPGRRRTASRVLDPRNDGQWFWRGMFESIPLPPAWPVYVSQAEARAYARVEGTPPADRSGVSTGPRSGRPTAPSASIPGVTPPPDQTRGNFDFAAWEPVPGRIAPGRRERVGRARSRRQRVGMDLHGLRSVRGFAPMASYPEYSADFFDGQHYVMKGASPGDGQRAAAPQLPQLVPAELSVRVRDVQDRGMSAWVASPPCVPSPD